MKTLANVRDEKMLNNAREESRARIEQARRENIAATLAHFPEVGTLNDGTFYAFVGPTRQYRGSKFLSAVIDAIIETRSNQS